MARCSGSDVRHGEECAARPAKRRVVTAHLCFPGSLADPLAQPHKHALDRSADLLSVILRSYPDVTLVITLPQLLWLLSLRLQLYVHVEKCSHGALLW